MGTSSTNWWTSLERWSGPAFLLGAAILAVDLALLAATVLGESAFPQSLGQALVGFGWTAAFVGLLGTYPGLADRRRWLARVGGVFAALGALVMAAMGATSLGHATGVLNVDFSQAMMYFLPGVFLTIVLGFGAVGVATLLTDRYSQALGLLFLVLPLTFLFNIGTGMAGFNPMVKVFGVVAVLVATMLAIGYLLRADGRLEDRSDVDQRKDAAA